MIPVQNGENRGIFKYISGVSGVSPGQRVFCDTKCVSGKTEKLSLCEIGIVGESNVSETVMGESYTLSI